MIDTYCLLFTKKQSNQYDSIPIRGKKPPTHSKIGFIKIVIIYILNGQVSGNLT